METDVCIVDIGMCACELSFSIVLEFVCWGRTTCWTLSSTIPASLAYAGGALSPPPSDAIIGLSTWNLHGSWSSVSQSSYLSNSWFIHWASPTSSSNGSFKNRKIASWNPENRNPENPSITGSSSVGRLRGKDHRSQHPVFDFSLFKFKSELRPSDQEAASR